MLAASALSDELIPALFQEIVWEHSHVVADRRWRDLRPFCIYEAPSEELIREHADVFGSHSITNIYELVDDVDIARDPPAGRRQTPPSRTRRPNGVCQSRKRHRAAACQSAPRRSTSASASSFSARVRRATACS